MRSTHAVNNSLTSDVELISVNKEDEALFPVSLGNEIRLYSNAYDYVPGSQAKSRASGAIADLFRELNAAKNHICIVGWALSPNEKFGENDDMLAELLVRKARENVKVMALLWDNIVPMFKDDTKKLLRMIESEIAKLPVAEQATVRNNLHFKFSPREFGYTDHQKMVIVDSALYIGGLDLIDGRANPETWHDCHARIDGEVVLNAFDMIHARWDCVKNKNPQDEHASRQLYTMRDEIQESLNKKLEHRTANPHKKMHLLCAVQKKYWGAAHEWPLSSQENTQEIQSAYLDAVKRAERFIYMETQFFVGNRLHKNQIDTIESDNHVVAAIVAKIIEKIKSGEDFHFYCQLPYRPDGKPDQTELRVVQRKQWNTMEWVIKTVDDAAKLHGKSAADYVTFYNMGRENNGAYQMRYTHAKLMIVDDKEMLFGSANCNERSMTGDRDSEVVIHLTGYDEQIINYREKLLCEHFGDELVSANAKLLIQHPEQSESRALLQKCLDNNLNNLGKTNIPVATPWGNIPFNALMNRTIPPHILQKTPLLHRKAMEWNTFLRKLPL